MTANNSEHNYSYSAEWALKIKAEREQDLLRPLETENFDSVGLLSDQVEALHAAKPIHGLLFGCGNLVHGFLASGVQALAKATGRNLILWTIVDLPAAAEMQQTLSNLIAKGYQLHPEVPYLQRKDFEPFDGAYQIPAQLSQLKPDFIFSATPAKFHISDAKLAEALNLSCFIEKPACLTCHSGQILELKQLLDRSPDRIQLVDFFYYADTTAHFFSNQANWLKDLGSPRLVQACCLEAHSLRAEEQRLAMLMNVLDNGGYLGADQLPHALVLIYSFIKGLETHSAFEHWKFDKYFRGHEVEVVEQARTLLHNTLLHNQVNSDYLLESLNNADTFMAIKGSQKTPESIIQLLACCGKGPQIPGMQDGLATDMYMLRIDCEHGRLDICLGDSTGAVPAYILKMPKASDSPAKLMRFENTPLGGYKLMLADIILAKQTQVNHAALSRLKVQSESCANGIFEIAEAYTVMNQSENLTPVVTYSSEKSELAIFPDEFAPSCSVFPQLKRGTGKLSCLIESR